MRFVTAALLWLSSSSSSTAAAASASSAVDDDTNTPPPFFLIDTTDQLCLSGEEFKRCSINTLFYVVGAPGNYKIHKRSLDGVVDAQDDGMCLSKKSCKDADADKPMDAKLAKCSHCGATNWNILGDNDTGYVLTEGDGKLCLVRQAGTTKAMTALCDSTDLPYTPLQLQFASAADISTMSSPGARLIGAASDGDKKAIQALLKEGVNVNVRDWDDLTALIPAASSGHVEICKLLVSKGIDVNAKDKDGITALMEASIMGHQKVVEFLLEKGAEVNAAASSEVTALWLAASEGRVEVMTTLLAKDADATNARVDGITALMTASVGGFSDAVKLLLDHGADPTVTDNDGLTPLMNAAENGTVATLTLLVDHANDPAYINLMSNTGFSPLIIAAAHGHVDAVEYLVGAAADVNAVHDNKVTALMYAAASGHVDAMTVLIVKGKATLDSKHTNGGTALLEAATGGMYDAMKLLVDSGAETDFTDDDGVTPLMAIAAQGNINAQTLILESLKTKKSPQELVQHINLLSFSGGSAVMFAAAGGHVESARQLMELGANIKDIARSQPGYVEKLQQMIDDGQVQDDDPHVDGVTALHVAAQGGHLEMVTLLLEAGADVAHVDDSGSTPLVLAVQGNYGEVASALVEGGSDPNTPYVDDEGGSHNLLFDAIMVENEEFALLLIQKGADISHKDEKKVTTLLQASHRGQADIVKALLETTSKSDFVDDASEDGITPLIAASSEGNVECVTLLIGHKADINAKDKDQTNALMAAAARGHLDVVTALLEAGANVNEQNSDGHTALMFAYNGKNQVETLWERYNQFVADAETDTGGNAIAATDDVDDNGTGPIIREALDNHTALVELLLKNGADGSLNDKEGHVANDFDFHPDTDSEILAKEAHADKIRDESKNEL
jgi:ankyrin repeat protein